MAKKKRAKRYTDEERQKILDFIAEHDAKNGRGGASAAMRKFGVAPMTLSVWKSIAGTGSSGGRPVPSKGKGEVLHRMAAIADQEAALKSEIAALKKEYTSLRKEL